MEEVNTQFHLLITLICRLFTWPIPNGPISLGLPKCSRILREGVLQLGKSYQAFPSVPLKTPEEKNFAIRRKMAMGSETIEGYYKVKVSKENLNFIFYQMEPGDV